MHEERQVIPPFNQRQCLDREWCPCPPYCQIFEPLGANRRAKGITRLTIKVSNFLNCISSHPSVQ